MSMDDIHQPAELDNLFTKMAETLNAEEDVNGTLQVICDLAVKVMEADHASITTVAGGRFVTAAQTGTSAAQADLLQYQTRQGPCLDAIRERDTVRSDELATEPRWPAFGKAVAEELSIHSMLAHILPMEDRTLAAINLFASRPHAFTEAHEHLVAIFGAQAGIALRAVAEHQRAENLERALHSNRRIAIAIGIVMSTEDLQEGQAFRRICEVSQHTNRKLAAVADEIVQDGFLAS